MQRVQIYPFSNLCTHLLKWMAIILIISALIGVAAALFLYSLNLVTNYRSAYVELVVLLPVAGLIIGLAYHYWGKNVATGNHLLIDAVHHSEKPIPLKLALFIYLSTLITHLFGGSAGREGTALQMAGSIADQLTKPFKLTNLERQTLIIAAIAGGFGAVFGTPLAGAIFSLEVFLIGKLNYRSIFPAFATAITADFICKLWNIPHIHYQINIVPLLSLLHLFYAAIAGIAFGLTALCFSKALHWLHNLFKHITYSPLQPVVGGALIMIAVFAFGTTKYIGLGIPTILTSFEVQLPYYDFLLKIAFTVITLAAGFKGGEVTPLFFIGATLGNTLSLFLPLPTAILAGMGFVAVFAGATNTPLACIILSLELFGLSVVPYTSTACIAAFLTSGNTNIYRHPAINKAKFLKYKALFKKI